MNSKVNKILQVMDYGFITPLVWILTIVAIVNSSQYYFFLYEGEKSFTTYFLITLSKLIYYYYFLLLAAVLLQVNSRINFAGVKIFTVGSIHFTMLGISFFVHQTFTYLIDKTLPGGNSSLAYFNSLFDNPNAWIDIVAYLLLLAAIVLKEYRKTKLENETKCVQLEHLLTMTKLNELRNKIHPGFLFNTLYSIKELISKGNNKEANQVLTMLSEFLRTTVYGNDKEKTELEKEIQFVELYLEIEKKSLGKMTYKISVAEETSNILIPNSLLQPIAEALIYETALANESAFNFDLETNLVNDELHIRMEICFGSEFNYNQESIEKLNAVWLAKERMFQMYLNSFLLSVSEKKHKALEIKIVIPVKVSELETTELLALEN